MFCDEEQVRTAMLITITVYLSLVELVTGQQKTVTGSAFGPVNAEFTV